MIAACDCKNDFQDSLHGKGMRAHNPCSPKADSRMGRCVVCGTERMVPK